MSKPEYVTAEFSLREWARFHRSDSKVQDIGYPKQTAFLNDGEGAGFYNEEERSLTVEAIEFALLRQPTLYLVAQCSFAFHSKEAIGFKSTQLFAQGKVWLGGTPNTQRIRYKELEIQLLAYIEGLFAGIDVPIEQNT